MKIMVLVLSAIVALSATAQEKDDVQVSPATAERCKGEGGCVLVSRKVMEELLQDAYKEGAQDAAEYLKGKTCKKGDWT
ncbi:hypothetical protein [uncultured Rhodoferax sp.]|uniref:hypothetical protein n=1 Tax=uncultured Rhodoferax sp. TaxID=223188 RepID=UPI0025FB8E21|nr:hypothetical protein [uncultured Rhodoferax sp.]